MSLPFGNHQGAGVIEIPLTQGRVALIDDADFALVSGIKWSLLNHSHSATCYAKSTTTSDDGRRSTLLMHRIILGVTDRNTFVDHANRNGLDNRRTNLRIATRSQNGANRVINLPNKNGLRGVVFLPRSNIFRAQISQGGVPTYLGSFKTAAEAHAAYVTKGRELFGEFFNL
jgi:HNH endonuclease